MYEAFTLYTEHATLNWLLTITEPSGGFTSWRLCLSEFDFEVKYKTWKANAQADPLSRLQTIGGTAQHHLDDFPAFDTQEEEDLSAARGTVDDTYANNFYATTENTADDPMLQPITIEELLTEQDKDAFCTEIGSPLNNVEGPPFTTNTHGILCRRRKPGHRSQSHTLSALASYMPRTTHAWPHTPAGGVSNTPSNVTSIGRCSPWTRTPLYGAAQRVLETSSNCAAM